MATTNLKLNFPAFRVPSPESATFGRRSCRVRRSGLLRAPGLSPEQGRAAVAARSKGVAGSGAARRRWCADDDAEDRVAVGAGDVGLGDGGREAVGLDKGAEAAFAEAEDDGGQSESESESESQLRRSTRLRKKSAR